MIDHWGRELIATGTTGSGYFREPDPATEEEFFKEMYKFYDNGFLSDDATMAIHKMFGSTEEDRNTWDLKGIERLYYKLEPTVHGVISYQEVGDYINANSELMNAEKIELIRQANSIKGKVQEWVDSADFPNTPWRTPYASIDFPQTESEAYASLKLSRIPTWSEMKITYSDRPSAVYSRAFLNSRGNVLNPVALDESTMLKLINSGYLGTLSDSHDEIIDLESYSLIVDGTYSRANRNDVVYPSAYANGTLVVEAGEHDKVSWAPLLEGGMVKDDIDTSRYSSVYYLPDGYNEGDTVDPPEKLFEIEIDIVSSTIESDGTSTEYYDDGLGYTYYLPRFIRNVNCTIRYRRINNALDLNDYEATEAASKTQSFALVSGTFRTSGRVACTEVSSEILSNFVSNKSSLDSLIMKSVQTIQEYVPDDVIFTTYSTENNIHDESVTTATKHIKVSEFELLPIKSASRLIGEAVTSHYDKKKLSGWKSFVGAVLTIVLIVVAFAFQQYWLLAVGSAVLAGGAYWAAKQGKYALAAMLGNYATIVGAVSMFMNIGTFIQEGFKKAGESAAMSAIKDYIGNIGFELANGNIVTVAVAIIAPIVNTVVTTVVNYANEIAKGLSSGVVETTAQVISKIANDMMWAVKAYLQVVNPYGNGAKSGNDNEDSDNPITPSTNDMLMEYTGGSPHRGIFELGEEFDATFKLMSHEGMCPASGAKYYS